MAKMYESPQDKPDGISTAQLGGSAPSKESIVKSANARGGKRHDMGGDRYADTGVLPSSGGSSVDKTGIKDQGYLVKKGIPYGVTAFFNTLPPGSDITDQENADIREEPMKMWTGGLSFPGDGW